MISVRVLCQKFPFLYETFSVNTNRFLLLRLYQNFPQFFKHQLIFYRLISQHFIYFCRIASG